MTNMTHNESRRLGLDWNQTGLVDAVLNGANLNDVRVSKKNAVYTEANVLENEIEDMIKTAKNHKDLDKVGEKLNYVINKSLYESGINVSDLQYNASKKMREIYNKIGEPRVD